MQTSLRRVPILPMLAAAGMLALVTLLLDSFQSRIELAIVVLVYLLPVGISAAQGGMITGTFSAVVSFLLINYFYTEPYFTFKVNRVEDLVALAAFLILTTTISQLVGRMKDSLATARARENETARLYELSVSLSRLPRETDIANSLARHTLDTFQAQLLEVFVEGDSAPLLARQPAGEGSPRQPDSVVSMQGAQRILGEIRLWREEPIQPAEERLLQAFATQGALALERARLTSAEARARILEESDKMKAALLSSVSHELRTPLATIKASVSSLNSEAVPWEAEARRDLLAAIEEETDRLNQLVGNLLNMSRIEAGALKLQRRWSMLADVALAAVKRTKSAAQNHKVRMEISDELPLVFLDDVLMEQVFANLIDNSCKYSPGGTTVHIRAEERNGMMWAQVSNESPRVSERDLDKIFEKFHRVTAADTITGTGLGLSICKGIVEAHGGKIRAVNLPGGFAIEFSIPVNAGGITPKMVTE
jgi:two-component system sensor histidine kinase KdpD